MTDSHVFFKSPIWQFNGQLQTIAPGILRKPKIKPYLRERFTLSDGDFVDLDWMAGNQSRLMIITHGLEGSSDRHYVRGMARYFHENNWDVLAWNCRSCSGEMNLKPRLYHHGEVEDISEVIKHAIETYKYDQIWLSGFSMGGNISLNYLGKHASHIPEQIKGATVCSAPLDLQNGVKQLQEPEGRFYRRRFFRMLSKKIIEKDKQFPGIIDIEKLQHIDRWEEFDRHFSAPLNGFKSELDFYQQASPINYFEKIKHPVLIVNALNDPLLGDKCYPTKLTANYKNIILETPTNGGHVGFSQRWKRESWFEKRSLDFIQQH